MRSFRKVALLIAGLSGATVAASAPAQISADPPAELGAPYVVDGVTVTPADGPFDDVGLAVIGSTASTISMAHRTLPLPSYAEVTALDTGRTILVRIEQRGPPGGPGFVALSAGAFAQIGADPSRPLGVRVRRVAPQEYERSLLRTGQRAPERLATPKPLLEVLRGRLAARPAATVQPAAVAVPAAVAPASSPAVDPAQAEAKAPNAKPSAKAAGSYVVQVASFANRAGAESTAKKLGGTVSSAWQAVARSDRPVRVSNGSHNGTGQGTQGWFCRRADRRRGQMIRWLRLAPLGLVALAAPAVPQMPMAPQAPVPLPLVEPETGVTAPIAMMLDLGSGRELYARGERRRFLPASLTKIMTTWVAFELIAAGRLDPRQRFAMSDAAFDSWHRVGSTMFLARGQVVTVDELLDGIMTVSANDGCIVLAEGASGSVAGFVALMNAEARRLGMTDSHFGTPNGWPDEGATYTSARDLAILTRAMITRHPALYRRYVGRTGMIFNGITQSNHVPLLGQVAGLDGVKTGFTNESGFGFVGSASRGGRRLVMVVAGYDNPRLRARESRDFLEWGFGAWEARRLFGTDQTVGTARVQGGADRAVALTAALPAYVTVPRGRPARYTLVLRYQGPILAPIRQGDQVGQLVVKVEGQKPSAIPLMAAHAVAEAGPIARLRNGVLEAVGL